MQSNTRLMLAAATLLVVGIGVWTYSRSPQMPAAQPSTSPHDSSTVTPAAVKTVAASSVETSNSSASTTSETDLNKLIADATGDDPNARSAAIVALASAPKDRALPVLQSLANGGDVADRQRALKSLTTIAVEQGDSENLIRDTMRQVIYHSEDEMVVKSAQTALEETESGLASASRVTTHP